VSTTVQIEVWTSRASRDALRIVSNRAASCLGMIAVVAVCSLTILHTALRQDPRSSTSVHSINFFNKIVRLVLLVPQISVDFYTSQVL
jgi:hypothetical protein